MSSPNSPIRSKSRRLHTFLEELHSQLIGDDLYMVLAGMPKHNDLTFRPRKDDSDAPAGLFNGRNSSRIYACPNGQMYSIDNNANPSVEPLLTQWDGILPGHEELHPVPPFNWSKDLSQELASGTPIPPQVLSLIQLYFLAWAVGNQPPVLDLQLPSIPHLVEALETLSKTEEDRSTLFMPNHEDKTDFDVLGVHFSLTLEPEESPQVSDDESLRSLFSNHEPPSLIPEALIQIFKAPLFG
ncbi:hypothetical protein K458DRAFT_382491 [Lentithecium fluviatile CBS 122367]|uniref:Uncharacterized protein n=1 Tax=Lentithecium fluviatile CBS 122367 TaxID=1168545 RepID=A0A6G1JL12_9PLEO|nr:hypothetical protein K458DRAFT_382491 [Lentithecium fluviatile CBS 122367]